MSAWARPGVKCVCVDATRGKYISKNPRVRTLTENGFSVSEGTEYVIREIVLSLDGKVCLKLEGVPDRSRFDNGYGIRRFRPFVPQRTEAEDVALFRNALTVTEPA